MLFSSVADLRASERRARQSEEVLVEANRLERLVVDLETGQRLVADNPEQHARAQRITQATSSYLHDYSSPLWPPHGVTGSRRRRWP